MKTDKAEKNCDRPAASQRVYRFIYDIFSTLVTAVLTIMLLFSFCFRMVGINGTSMLPTLEDKDYVITTAFNYQPAYGQIVIITQPNYFNEPLVKRIIATENQVVDIDFQTGAVSVDGKVLDEPYINNATLNSEGVEFPVTVPEGHVFVMGDNRQGSTDSRSDKVGFIDERYILGTVKLKITGVDESTGKSVLYPFSEWRVE